MNNPLPPLSDLSFVQQFEALTLDPHYFNHLGHLRLAWLYLERYPLDTAIDRTCTGIKAYAESLGAHDKFNYTITDAIVRIIARRRGSMANPGWADFLSHNKDLIEDALSVLDRHYSRDILFGEQARRGLVLPDRQPI